MFAIGLLMVLAAVAMVGVGVFGSLPAGGEGLAAGGVGIGLAGLLLVYVDAPSRRPKLPPGKVRGTATVLAARPLAAEVAGYRMVELTLEVVPKDGGIPFQATRKFSAGRLGRISSGRKLDVVYDPANPRQLDLA